MLTREAMAAPAVASDGRTNLSAGNGTVGVNQVLTATNVSKSASTSCDDETGVVNFDFHIGFSGFFKHVNAAHLEQKP